MDTCGLERAERFRFNLNERKFASPKNTLTYTVRRTWLEKESQLHRWETLVDVMTGIEPVTPWWQSRTILSKSSFRFLQLQTFPTNRGVCFSLKANSNMLKTIHSCTVRTRTISAITCTPCKWRKRLRHPDLWNLLEAYQMSVHVENAFAYAVRCAGAVWSEAFEG